MSSKEFMLYHAMVIILLQSIVLISQAAVHRSLLLWDIVREGDVVTAIAVSHSQRFAGANTSSHIEHSNAFTLQLYMHLSNSFAAKPTPIKTR